MCAINVSRKLVPFFLILVVELGITEPQRRMGLTMQETSLLRAGVYEQRWKWPVCGTDLGQFSQGSFPRMSREHGTDLAPLFCTFGALLRSP